MDFTRLISYVQSYYLKRRDAGAIPASSAAAADGAAYCPLDLLITAEQEVCKNPGTKLPAERRLPSQAQDPADEGV